jgi:hypothetical protein
MNNDPNNEYRKQINNNSIASIVSLHWHDICNLLKKHLQS